jgi:hypothetical protein
LQGVEESPSFEVATKWKEKRGRVDIRIDIPENNQVVVVEIEEVIGIE